MGSSAASRWQQFIQLVDQLPQAADPTSLLDSMLHFKNTQLDNLATCSPAEWEALVLKKKVKQTAIAALLGPDTGLWVVGHARSLCLVAVKHMPTVFRTCLLPHRYAQHFWKGTAWGTKHVHTSQHTQFEGLSSLRLG